MPYEIRHSTAAARLQKLTALPPGHQGSTSDEHEMVVGSEDTAIGRFVTSPQAPRSGLDVRRMFGVASQGQSDTWTDVDAVAQDASGMVLSPKPGADGASGGGTDVVTTGYILPYELADGGTITIEAVGTYKPGSIAPKILAKLKIGGAYVAPQYEGSLDVTGTAATPLDIGSTVADCFEWSCQTCGLNAIGGYEALFLDAAQLEPGEFQWRLTMKVHALGRWAKWQRGNDDSGTRDRNCWVESTLEWGALQYNGGCRTGDPGGYGNPMGQRISQWTPFVQRDTGTPENGTVRGGIYTFLGRQYLCHAASDSGAQLINADVANWATPGGYVFGDIVESLSVAVGTFYKCIAGHAASAAGTGAGTNEPGIGDDEHLFWQRVYYNEAAYAQMMAEEAPGLGLHWREYFVPAVSKATISGFATVDWTLGNEIQLELGGPQQDDLGLAWPAYSATTQYNPEAGSTPFTNELRAVEAGGVQYSAKTFLYVATSWPRLIAGVKTNLWTAAPTGASPDSERAWRALPATLRDEMRVQQCHGYLFGRRNGVAERRV